MKTGVTVGHFYFWRRVDGHRYPVSLVQAMRIGKSVVVAQELFGTRDIDIHRRYLFNTYADAIWSTPSRPLKPPPGRRGRDANEIPG